MVAGVASVRTSGIRDTKRLINVVLRFPTDDLARRATTDFDKAFRDHDPKQKPVPLAEVPDAHVDGQDGGKALTAFTAHGPYLIVSNLGFPTTTDRSAQIGPRARR